MQAQAGRVRVIVGNLHHGESSEDFRYVVSRLYTFFLYMCMFMRA
jgi:hypothetical protein